MLKKDLKINFKHNKKPVKLVVKAEDYKTAQILKTEFAVAFRKAISMGVATRASMTELLKREDVWTQEDDNNLLQKTIEVSILEGELAKHIENGSKNMAREVAFKLLATRAEIYELIQIKHLPLEHTAEVIAEDVKLDNYITLCTFDTNTGKRYFVDHNDFLKRREDKDVIKVYEAVVQALSKDNVDMLRNLPENRWLVDENLIDKDGNPMTEELANVLEEVQADKAAVVLEEEEAR